MARPQYIVSEINPETKERENLCLCANKKLAVTEIEKALGNVTKALESAIQDVCNDLTQQQKDDPSCIPFTDVYNSNGESMRIERFELNQGI